MDLTGHKLSFQPFPNWEKKRTEILLRDTKGTRRWDNGDFNQMPLSVKLDPEKHSRMQDIVAFPKRWVCPSTAVCCKLQKRLQFTLGQPEIFATLCFVCKPGCDLAASSFYAIQAISEAPLLCLVLFFRRPMTSSKVFTVGQKFKALAACSAKAPSHVLQDRHISSLILWKSTFNCTAVRNQLLFFILFKMDGHSRQVIKSHS